MMQPLVTWVIELAELDADGQVVEERITCHGLNITPNGEVFAIAGNDILKGWASGVWNRFWRSSIQPVQQEGHS